VLWTSGVAGTRAVGSESRLSIVVKDAGLVEGINISMGGVCMRTKVRGHAQARPEHLHAIKNSTEPVLPGAPRAIYNVQSQEVRGVHARTKSGRQIKVEENTTPLWATETGSLGQLDPEVNGQRSPTARPELFSGCGGSIDSILQGEER
jgi:hypothetical protein